jgi:hypothetical protein
MSKCEPWRLAHGAFSNCICMERARFSLSRMLAATAMVAFIAALFHWLPAPFAGLTLCLGNLVSAAWFHHVKRREVANLAILTAALILATLYYTEWGLSSPSGRIIVAWPFFGAAALAQVGMLTTWLLVSPRS